MSRGQKQRYTAQEVIDACPETGGIMAIVAKKLGCDRSTVARYAKRYVTVQRALDAADEAATDLAENKSMTLISEGYWPAIKYRLSTKGKRRGYVERVEQRHAGPDGGPIKTESVNYGPAEHARAIAALVQALRPIGNQADGGEQDAVGAAVATPVAGDSELSG